MADEGNHPGDAAANHYKSHFAWPGSNFCFLSGKRGILNFKNFSEFVNDVPIFLSLVNLEYNANFITT